MLPVTIGVPLPTLYLYDMTMDSFTLFQLEPGMPWGVVCPLSPRSLVLVLQRSAFTH